MTKQESKWNAKAEAVLMGMTQKVYSNEEATYIAGYIAKVLNYDVTGEDIFKEATAFTKGAVIQYVNVATVYGMRMLALPMTTEEDEEPFNLLSPYGAFGYVYNFDAPSCSELGYACFENKNGRIRRCA